MLMVTKFSKELPSTIQFSTFVFSQRLRHFKRLMHSASVPSTLKMLSLYPYEFVMFLFCVPLVLSRRVFLSVPSQNRLFLFRLSVRILSWSSLGCCKYFLRLSSKNIPGENIVTYATKFSHTKFILFLFLIF